MNRNQHLRLIYRQDPPCLISRLNKKSRSNLYTDESEVIFESPRLKLAHKRTNHSLYSEMKPITTLNQAGLRKSKNVDSMIRLTQSMTLSREDLQKSPSSPLKTLMQNNN